MCQSLYAHETDTLRNELAKKGYLIMYKVVEIQQTKRRGTSIKSMTYSHKWKKGWNTTRCKINSKKLNWQKTSYEYYYTGSGIYCYRDKDIAQSRSNYSGYVVLPVKAMAKDLIGANRSVAIFTKVFVYAEDFDRIIKENQNEI